MEILSDAAAVSQAGRIFLRLANFHFIPNVPKISQAWATPVGVLAVLLLVQSGNAAHHFPDYPVRPAGEYPVKVTRAGITVAVEPVESVSDQKTYFNMELTSKGFLPVFVVIENVSSKSSYIFQRSNVGYVSVSVSSAAEDESEEKAMDNDVAVPMPAAVHFNPMSIVGASEIQGNILKKELQSNTLAPGVSIHGFLYIPVPKKGPRQKIHLQIPMAKAGANETHVYNLFF